MEDRVKQRKIEIIFDRTLELMSAVGIVMIAFTMLATCVHIIMRYALGKPLNWVIDVSSILLLYITFLSAAWLLREEKHVAMDIVVNNLKPRRQIILQIINSLFCSAVCAIIVVFGIIETISVWRFDLSVDMALEPPKWLVVIIIPLGSLILLIQFIRRTHGFVKKLRHFKQG